MSLISNAISGIGNNLGGIKSTPDFNLDDSTFADLLEKQLLNKIDSQKNNTITGLGMPAGFQIENLDGTEFSETAQDQMEAIGEKINIEENNISNPFDMDHNGDVTGHEAISFFSSLLNSDTKGDNARSELFDFAKKQAANFYNKYSKTVVNNLEDFATDIKSIIN